MKLEVSGFTYCAQHAANLFYDNLHAPKNPKLKLINTKNPVNAKFDFAKYHFEITWFLVQCYLFHIVQDRSKQHWNDLEALSNYSVTGVRVGMFHDPAVLSLFISKSEKYLKVFPEHSNVQNKFTLQCCKRKIMCEIRRFMKKIWKSEIPPKTRKPTENSIGLTPRYIYLILWHVSYYMIETKRGGRIQSEQEWSGGGWDNTRWDGI